MLSVITLKAGWRVVAPDLQRSEGFRCTNLGLTMHIHLIFVMAYSCNRMLYIHFSSLCRTFSTSSTSLMWWHVGTSLSSLTKSSKVTASGRSVALRPHFKQNPFLPKMRGFSWFHLNATCSLFYAVHLNADCFWRDAVSTTRRCWLGSPRDTTHFRIFFLQNRATHKNLLWPCVTKPGEKNFFPQIFL